MERHELEAFGEFQWWTLDELDESPEPAFPIGHVSAVRDYLGAGADAWRPRQLAR